LRDDLMTVAVQHFITVFRLLARSILSPLNFQRFLQFMTTTRLLCRRGFVYNLTMYSRFVPSPRSKAVRNAIAMAVALGFTFLVFQFLALFNGVLKVVNEITSEMALRCRDGYDLVAAADGTPTCVPKPPPPVPGIVTVTLPSLVDKGLAEKPTSPQTAPAAQQKPSKQ
jgi:hypothetical protein